ncbi:heavy-metal-associated domain-containing protein [Exiguobacterium sp. CinTr1]|uniref:heavy-metal-associated domain-containing protein n=1 Tax=Exiguobacterium sp. CinTr1 TaxID=2995315 RepID=UPI0022E442E0|nr:copper ion binding protein [Exiguobacterium sp. CinTr1]
MKKSTFQVAGMSCGSCINKIEGHVGKLAGIESVKVNLSAGEVDVTFDESQLTLSEIETAIQENGYEVTEATVKIGCSCCK